MRLIENQLYLEFDELVTAIAATEQKETDKVDKYLRKSNSTGNRLLPFIKDPACRTKVLYDYTNLADKYKAIVIKHYGDPYEYVAKEPLRQLLEKDFKAEQFFLQYRNNENKSLPLEHRNKYVTAASWLNLIDKLSADTKHVKKVLGLSMESFWSNIIQIITADKIDLPTSYRRLIDKMKKYKAEGYESLIDWRFGNSLAAKVKGELSESQLISLLENEKQYDDVLICLLYNQWANSNNFKTIKPATVAHWRRAKEFEITLNRKGNSAFNEKFIRQVKGMKPSVPLALVEHDDNNLDFLYKDESGYVFNKYVAIVVIDSRTKLVLGKSYAVGQNPQQWQVHHAYLDAMYYIRSITGGWYLPFEIKADRWASTSLKPFYNKIAKFVEPSHGNKHRGYIEQFFGSPLWKRSQQLVSEDNWSGNNITARNSGVNKDHLKLHTKSRPLIGDQAEVQIENFFHLLRTMPDFTKDNLSAQSKEQQFLEQWACLSEADKRPITDEQFLLTFGIKHQPRHTNGIRITNRGVEPQIKGCQYSYDLPESWMYNKLIGEKIEVYYDPYDMSRILVTNHRDVRFVAKTAELSPRALKDTHNGSRTFLNTILAEKKAQVKEVVSASAARKELTDTSFYNAEAMLQGGVLIKEIKNEAEQKMLENFNTEHEAFLNENTDFDDFFTN